MTAIAYRDGIMAADSAAWTGADAHLKIPSRPKIVRLNDGSLLACAGSLDDIHQFEEWMKDGGVPKGEKFDKEEGFCAVVVRPSGDVLKYWASLRPQPSAARFVALGRPELFMHGAMAAGASADQAVRLAIEHTDGAGGDVQVEYLKQDVGDPGSIIEVTADQLRSRPGMRGLMSA